MEKPIFDLDTVDATANINELQDVILDEIAGGSIPVFIG